MPSQNHKSDAQKAFDAARKRMTESFRPFLQKPITVENRFRRPLKTYDVTKDVMMTTGYRADVYTVTSGMTVLEKQVSNITPIREQMTIVVGQTTKRETQRYHEFNGRAADGIRKTAQELGFNNVVFVPEKHVVGSPGVAGKLCVWLEEDKKKKGVQRVRNITGFTCA